MTTISVSFDVAYFEQLVSAIGAAVREAEDAVEREAVRSPNTNWDRVDAWKLVASQRRTIRNDLAAILRRSTGCGEFQQGSFEVGNDAADSPLTLKRAYDMEDDYIEAVHHVRAIAVDCINGSVKTVTKAMHAAYRAFAACNRTDYCHIREFYADVDDALSTTPYYRTEEGKIEAHVELLSVEDKLEPYCDDEFHIQFKFRLANTTTPIDGTEIVYLHQGKMYPLAGVGSRARDMLNLSRSQERALTKLLRLKLASMPFPTGDERAQTWS